jgi:hypothetical protein
MIPLVILFQEPLGKLSVVSSDQPLKLFGQVTTTRPRAAVILRVGTKGSAVIFLNFGFMREPGTGGSSSSAVAKFARSPFRTGGVEEV